MNRHVLLTFANTQADYIQNSEFSDWKHSYLDLYILKLPVATNPNVLGGDFPYLQSYESARRESQSS